MEKKTYYLGYNRYNGTVMVYGSVEIAEESRSWWKIVEAFTFDEAVKEFLEEYRKAHVEEE